MLEGIKVDRTLDQKGLLCPMPIINTAREVSKLSSGQILEVLSTDPGAPLDFEGWADNTGNILLDSIVEDTNPRTFKFYIKKQ